ncbi:MAG: hypothetical protein IPG66_02345 [Hydrogenophilales bacterium]|nr:hypothetical protein [Hydrogenophilales bacterium]
MDLKRLLNAKTVRFVAVTVILGAIGSGAWEWILKPLAMGASEFGLNVATLGVSSFKDSLYQDIAKGLHEEPSLRLYSAVFGLLPLFVLGFIAGKAAASRQFRGDVEDLEPEKVARFLSKPLLVVFVIMVAFSVIQANQVAYVNRAVTHFDQLMSIVAPSLPEIDRLSFRSQFAQIASGEDYEKLVSSLEQLCNEKGLRAPSFSVW